MAPDLELSSAVANAVFDGAINEAVQCYQNDEPEKCQALAESLLANSNLPRYYRIKVLILLCGVCEERYQAHEYLREGEGLWRVTKRAHPEGGDATVDFVLGQLRDELDRVSAALEKDWDGMEDADLREVEGEDEEAEKEEEEMEEKIEREMEEDDAA